MLAIRMQRTGRKGHAQFRMVVQDSRRTPTSGNIVALVGNHDPHAKTTNIDKEKVVFYLSNGAQPSPRVIKILRQEKVKLPTWVELPKAKKSKTKHVEKLRKNRPPEEKTPEVAKVVAENTLVEGPNTAEPIETKTPSVEEPVTAEPAEADSSEVETESPQEPETADKAEDETTPEVEKPKDDSKAKQ